MTSCETFHQADNVESKEDNVEVMIKKHEDFDKPSVIKRIKFNILIGSSNLSIMLVLTSIRRRKMYWKEALIEKRAQLGEYQTIFKRCL